MNSENFQCLDIRTDGDVLIVEINNRANDLNLVDGDLHHDLVKLFNELKGYTQSRAVLLTGHGRVFSAGGDFEWFKTMRDLSAVSALNRGAKQMIWDLLDVEIPLVTAVHGVAMGLGASIALFSDAIFMAESASISDPHVRAGIVAGDGGVVAWPLGMGPAKAKEYLMTGDPIAAAEAERVGLINHCVPDDELYSSALAYAKRLAAGAPLAIRYTKLAVNKLIKDSLNAAFDVSTAHEMLTFMSEDHREAVDAFLEKRPPHFEGC